MRKSIALPVLVAGLALTTSACQFSLGEKKVERAAVETQIQGKLGVTATCPGDLSGKVGATLRCTALNAPGGFGVVTVTVTSVEGDTVNFNMRTGT